MSSCHYTRRALSAAHEKDDGRANLPQKESSFVKLNPFTQPSVRSGARPLAVIHLKKRQRRRRPWLQRCTPRWCRTCGSVAPPPCSSASARPSSLRFQGRPPRSERPPPHAESARPAETSLFRATFPMESVPSLSWQNSRF
jgi:hypothetical protein